MSWGLAALSGLLGGLQGLPKGMNEGMQFDQRQQQIDLQRRQLEEGNSTDLTTLAPILKAAGMDVGAASGRVPNAVLPLLVSAQQKKDELGRKAQIGQDLSRKLLEQGTSIGMAPGASVEMPQPGAMMAPPAAGPMPAMTQKRVDPNMAALAKFMPMLAQLDPAGATGLVKSQFAPDKDQLVGESTRGYLRGGKFTELPQPPAAAVPPGMTPKSFKQSGVTYETPRDPKEGPQPTVGGDLVRTLDALDAARAAGNAAEVARLTKRLDTLKSYVTPEGGMVVGAGSGNVIAQGPARTQPMPGSETSQLADMRTIISKMDAIGELLKPGYVGPMQGRLGAGRQVSGFGATASEATFRSAVSELSNEILKLRSGAAVTPQEYTRIQAELPQANDPEVVFKAKLTRARGMLQQALQNREQEFAAKGFRGATPPPIQPAETPAPKGESLSRRDPRYQGLRQRGLSDQQIQQQFGVTVTD